MPTQKNKKELTTFIKKEAIQVGFAFCGISKAEALKDDADRLADWLNQGLHGKMSYMENHFDKRTDPRLLVPGAKSVISLLFNYFPSKKQLNPAAPKISRYAYGKDYHKQLKKKLKILLDRIETHVGKDLNARLFTDSAPVLDKAWAAKSGLGWIGKNSLLITKQYGSYFFIADLICDLELQYDSPIKDYCGTCTRCIDACPTGAIIDDRKIDASKCISYLTIELKDDKIPEEFAGKMENRAFGCDICQEVCPWNRFAEPNDFEPFKIKDEVANLTKEEWENMNEATFEELFNGTPLRRAKYSGLKRNIKFLKKTEKPRK